MPAPGRSARAARRDRELIKRLIQLLVEVCIISEQRERKAEERRGLRLDHIQRLAGSIGVLFQDPVLYLRAAIGEDDLVELVFDRGVSFKRGCNGRQLPSLRLACGGLRRAAGCAGAACRRLCGLRLSLRGGGAGGRLGLEKYW